MPKCTKCRSKYARSQYFKLPSDIELKKKWCDFLKIDVDRAKKETKLCHRHFTDDCFFTEGDTKSLKENAVPSIEVVIRHRNNSGKIKPKRKCILCGNNSPDLTFFPIPKTPELRSKWETFCEFDMGDLNYYLCHLHFKLSDMIIENGKRRLQPNAIPSVFFDDYQFQFIPVGRKTTSEHELSDADVIDPNVLMNSHLNNSSQMVDGSNEDSVISIDFAECVSPVEMKVFEESNRLETNASFNDIANINIPCNEISIPNGEHSNTVHGSVFATNDRSVSEKNQITGNNSLENPPKRKKRMCYPGDIKRDDINSLEIAKRSIEHMQSVITKKNRKIKTLSHRVRRLSTRVDSLKQLVRQLRVEKIENEIKEDEDPFQIKGWWDS